MSPAVAGEPVEASVLRKVRIPIRRIRNIADHGVHPSLVGGDPAGVEVTYDGRGVYEVAPVEVMIVVARVAKVVARVARRVRRRGDETSPDRCQDV